MRTITLLAGATLALTSTAALAKEAEHRFNHEGSTYVYSTRADRGRTVISGRRLPNGEAFRLVVSGQRVTGTSAGQPVSFRTASAKGAAGGIEVASN